LLGCWGLGVVYTDLMFLFGMWCLQVCGCWVGGLVVLNDLMYLFKDSLERLQDIKQIEDSRKDTQVCLQSGCL
jgi:hypothetical protein